MKIKNDKKLFVEKLKLQSHKETNLSLSSNIIFTSNKLFFNNKKEQKKMLLKIILIQK